MMNHGNHIFLCKLGKLPQSTQRSFTEVLAKFWKALGFVYGPEHFDLSSKEEGRSPLSFNGL
jgi:hypothetical protein